MIFLFRSVSFDPSVFYALFDHWHARYHNVCHLSFLGGFFLHRLGMEGALFIRSHALLLQLTSSIFMIVIQMDRTLQKGGGEV